MTEILFARIEEVNAAQTTADTAQATANDAQITADAAQVDADAAQTTANAAQTAANAAQALATSIDAFIPLVVPTADTITTLTVKAAIKTIFAQSKTTAGDGGSGMWVRVSSLPAHAAFRRSVDRFLPTGVVDSANGGYWEYTTSEANGRVFGMAPGVANNGPAMQAMITYCDLKGVPWYIPAGTYPFTTGVTVSNHYNKGRGDGMRTVLRWDNTTQYLFTLEHPDADVGAGTTLLLPQFIDLWLTQGSGFVPTAGGAFNCQLVSQAEFRNIRTDNFFIHYNTAGMTRVLWEGSRMYGSTLFPLGSAVAGSKFINLGEYTKADTTVQHAANVLINGCEIAGNSANHKNMEIGIDVRGVDGFYMDTATYIGLTKSANIRFLPARAASPLTNIDLQCFNDGGQSTSDSCIQFLDVVAHSGTCNAIRIGGILSGAAGNGILINMSSLSDIRINSTIRACAAYGLNVTQGSGIDATGVNMFGNSVGDINLAGSGNNFTMAGGHLLSSTANHINIGGTFDYVNVGSITCRNASVADVNKTNSSINMRFDDFITDRSNTIADGATFSFPLGQSVFVVNGNTNRTSLTELGTSYKNRKVTLLFTGTPTVTHGAAANMFLQGGVNFAAANSNALSLFCPLGADFYEYARKT